MGDVTHSLCAECKYLKKVYGIWLLCTQLQQLPIQSDFRKIFYKKTAVKGLSSLVGRDAFNVDTHFYNSLFIYLFIYRTAESANPDDICRALGLCYHQKGQKMCALYKKTVKVGYHYVSPTSITACLG